MSPNYTLFPGFCFACLQIVPLELIMASDTPLGKVGGAGSSGRNMLKVDIHTVLRFYSFGNNVHTTEITTDKQHTYSLELHFWCRVTAPIQNYYTRFNIDICIKRVTCYHIIKRWKSSC